MLEIYEHLAYYYRQMMSCSIGNSPTSTSLVTLIISAEQWVAYLGIGKLPPPLLLRQNDRWLPFQDEGSLSMLVSRLLCPAVTCSACRLPPLFLHHWTDLPDRSVVMIVWPVLCCSWWYRQIWCAYLLLDCSAAVKYVLWPFIYLQYILIALFETDSNLCCNVLFEHLAIYITYCILGDHTLELPPFTIST